MVVNNREQDDCHVDDAKKQDDDDDDDELLSAVAQWAHQKETENDTSKPIQRYHNNLGERDAKSSERDLSLSSPPPYAAPYNPDARGFDTTTKGRRNNSLFSLHITNLPYSCTKEAIMKVFEEKGCKIASTRLVYNYQSTRRHIKDNQKNQGINDFSGVAFVDMVDKSSYRTALGMDKMQWVEPSKNKSKRKGGSSRDSRGRHRKINIRPTRTKEELALIVKKTEERLALKKDEERNKQTNSKKRTRENKMTIESDSRSEPELKAKKQRQEHKEPSPPDKKHKEDRLGKASENSQQKNKGDKLPAGEVKKDNVQTKKLSKKGKKLSEESIKQNKDNHLSGKAKQTLPNMAQTLGNSSTETNCNNKLENKSKNDDEEKSRCNSVKVKNKTKKKLSKKERAKKAAILRSIRK